MNYNWPFSTLFLGLYHTARELNWSYDNRPVTIAWLLGYYYCLLADSISIENPFKPRSLAWNDFCNGFNACTTADEKYTLNRESINA